MTSSAAKRLEPLVATAIDAGDRALLRGHLRRAERYLTGDADAPPLPSILGLLGHHPPLAGRWLAFSGALLDEPVLDPRHRELLILRVAWRTRCGYEWAQHERIGREYGLTDEQIAAVVGPVDDPAWTPLQRALVAAADQLVDGHRVEDATWEVLAGTFDEKQLLELLFVVGSYVCLALVVNSAGLEAEPGPDGRRPTLPRWEG